MTDFGGYRSNVSFFATPTLPAAAFAGVRSRRVMAFAFDFVLVSALAVVLSIALFVLTLGLSIFFLPSLWPFVAFFYNGLSISGRHMATPGMRLFDLQMRHLDGAPPSFLAAAVHGVMLYLSWLFLPIFLVSLVSPDKRCLHDMFAGLLVVRRPD